MTFRETGYHYDHLHRRSHHNRTENNDEGDIDFKAP